MSDKVLAWWFEPNCGVLGFGDGRKPGKGRTHKVKCDPVLCEAGLHASVSPLDALQYAKSANVWRVEIGGVTVLGADKLSGTERTYIYMVNSLAALRAFARLQALKVAHMWSAPAIVTDFLRTGDESKSAAAAAAAWDAAVAAARDAARYAANAASAAAVAAARDAARCAASAAWDAASASRYAASDAARKDLGRMLEEAHNGKTEWIFTEEDYT